ncbi:MAG: PEP-utilizing enzyme [Patescibacteria group bacterium]|nr:PEP-utilizing enzyme [Patescibacteria group bacterium]
MIKGKIFVIKRRLWKTEDLLGFKDGMILIVKNTTPDVTVIIDKVKAIVTEINSPLCHAAIIAREYNKPILMGVEEVTKQFNTGEEVAINLENETIIRC